MVVSCQDEVYPKPPAFLRLNYPQAEYIGFESQCPFIFDINSNEAKQIEIKSNCAITIKYPTMKASLFLTYREVNQNIDTYQQAFGGKFVLINNDPNGKLEYDPAYAREKFFKTVKGSGKVYTPDEKAKRDKEIADLNANLQQLIQSTPEFTSMADAKSKINSFLK